MAEYYDSSLEWANVRSIAGSFRLVQSSIQTADLGAILDGVGQVFHLAGQPGVRGSWRSGFEDHLENNVRATRRLLEACRDRQVPRLVYASSSSVYGNALSFPTSESTIPRPYSPHGFTKLAAEHLCHAYAENFGLHVVAVRSSMSVVEAPCRCCGSSSWWKRRPDIEFASTGNRRSQVTPSGPERTSPGPGRFSAGLRACHSKTASQHKWTSNGNARASARTLAT